MLESLNNWKKVIKEAKTSLLPITISPSPTLLINICVVIIKDSTLIIRLLESESKLYKTFCV